MVVVASSVLSNNLPRLATAGRAIVDAESGQPVILRGVNRSGLEYAEPAERGFLASAGISESELEHIVRVWGANVVRIPFNQDWLLNGRGRFSGTDYLEAIDRIIFWASRGGAYTLLDLQWLDADAPRGWNRDGSCNRVAALPNAASIHVWGIIAERYRSQSAVLFDIFNEPHDPIRGETTLLDLVDDEGRIHPITTPRVGMPEWQPWARQLVRTIRESHPRSLIFVPGVRWAYDLRGMPLTVRNGASEVFPNVVYSTHVYPWCGRPLRLKYGYARAALRRDKSPSWREAFGSLARHSPVFIGEWGGGPEHVKWGESLARYARWLGIGWTAWSWSDWPRLVLDAQAQRYDETDFGRLVRLQLTATPSTDARQRSANINSPNF